MFCQYQQTRIALLTLVSLRCGFKLLSGLYAGFVRLLVGLHHDGLYLARSPSFTVCFYLVVLAVWSEFGGIFNNRLGMICQGGNS